MTPRPLRTLLAAATAVLLLALPGAAAASSSMEIGIADENVLNGLTPGGTAVTVAKWKAAGVQDVRIFAQWNKLAPDVNATKPPAGFDSANPAAYDFAPLDQKIDAVVQAGMNVTLVVTGPGPVWTSSEPARLNGAWRPDPKLFGEFSSAVAKHVGSRVNRYIVWNEPNQKTWLQPQYACVGRSGGKLPACTSVAPHVYRDLARASYTAIHAADPDARVAVGATSSRGDALPISTTATTQPLTFLREMACVSPTYAVRRTGECKGFKPVTGDALAYHPHSLAFSPGHKDPDKNNARMADLPRLTGVLDRLTAKDRLKVVGAKKMPLWLDEYGYQTNPPDPKDGFQSPALAATYLQWGWSVAARNPRVQTLTQYEWFDEPTGKGDREFNRWQSGLYTVTGKPKPLAAVFSNPIFAWRTAKGANVWGQVRPGDTATSVRLQRRTGSGGYKPYKTIQTNASGYFQVRVPASTSASYRFVYLDPSTNADVTSAATKQRKL